MRMKKRMERLEATVGRRVDTLKPRKPLADWEATIAEARSNLSPEELAEQLRFDEIFEELFKRTPMPRPAEEWVAEYFNRHAEAEALLEKELGRKRIKPSRRNDS